MHPIVTSTAFHLQTDRETERVNQELEVYLRIFTMNHPTDWVTYLPNAQFAYNNRDHSTTKASPFYLMMGYYPRTIPYIMDQTNAPSIEQHLKNLEKAQDEALVAHKLSRRMMEDRIQKHSPYFQKGQQVWLEAKNLKLPYAHRKLAPKCKGPFEVSEVMGPATYRIKLPQAWRIHPIFHTALLSPYRENDMHGPNYTRPPPDKIEGESCYEVESIIKHQ